MHEFAHARQSIEAMIRSGDLEGLLRQAEALHGHLCPMVAMGVKAGQYAMKFLDTGSTGMEEVVAVVECNNCFTDGIQVVTGCTFGNNALIFRDLGKTAVTVARRGSDQGVRLVVRPEYREEMFARYPAAGPLFEKVVVQRNATPEEEHHLHHIWPAIAYKELERHLEESLVVAEVKVKHHPRRFGTSKYGWERIPRGFFDLLTILFLTRYLQRPMHFFGALGLSFTAFGLFISRAKSP